MIPKTYTYAELTAILRCANMESITIYERDMKKNKSEIKRLKDAISLLQGEARKAVRILNMDFVKPTHVMDDIACENLKKALEMYAELDVKDDFNRVVSDLTPFILYNTIRLSCKWSL